MRWTQPHNLKRPLKGQDGKLDHPNRGSEEGPVMKVTTIGIDLAKGLEACTSAHYWARELGQLGHRVKLMSPRFVKPYRKAIRTTRMTPRLFARR